MFFNKNHRNAMMMAKRIAIITYESPTTKLLRLMIVRTLFSCCFKVDHASISLVLRIISLFLRMIVLSASYLLSLSNMTYKVAGNGFSMPNFWKLLTTSGIFFCRNANASSLDENITLSPLDSNSSLRLMTLLLISPLRSEESLI